MSKVRTLNNSFVVASCEPVILRPLHHQHFGFDKRRRATREKATSGQRPKPRRPTRRAAQGFRAALWNTFGVPPQHRASLGPNSAADANLGVLEERERERERERDYRTIGLPKNGSAVVLCLCLFREGESCAETPIRTEGCQATHPRADRVVRRIDCVLAEPLRWCAGGAERSS